MLRLDLEAAGIPYVVEGPDGPLFCDFHSLRHSLCGMLDRSGATLKTPMQIMRHSDPKLTAKRYGRAQLHDLAGAVDKLPPLMGPSRTPTREAKEMRATGTDDSAPLRLAPVLYSPAISDAGTCELMRESPIDVTADGHTVSPRNLQGMRADEGRCGNMTGVETKGVRPLSFQPPKPKVAGSTPAGHTFADSHLSSSSSLNFNRDKTSGSEAAMSPLVDSTGRGAGASSSAFADPGTAHGRKQAQPKSVELGAFHDTACAIMPDRVHMQIAAIATRNVNGSGQLDTSVA